MAGYIGNIPVPQALRNYDVFTATSGQTVFNVKSYDPSFIDVYQNGVKLIDGDDYTATDGNTVVLASGATLNDIVEVISFTTFYPADVVSASAGGTFFGAVSFDADVTVSGDLTIPDKIVHTGDTNTAIRFPAADTVTVETAGSERMRINSSGNVGIGTGTSAPSATLTVGAPNASAVLFVSNPVANFGGGIAFDAGSGNDIQLINYRSSNMQFGNSGSVHMTIDVSGNVGIDQISPTYTLHIADGGYTSSSAQEGIGLDQNGTTHWQTSSSSQLRINDSSSSAGTHNYLIFYYQGSVIGDIDTTDNSVIRYNTFTGAHWSQMHGSSDLLRGTVMSTIDELMEWTSFEFISAEGQTEKIAMAGKDYVIGQTYTIPVDEDGATAEGTAIGYETASRLMRVKVSDVEGDPAVYGVFSGAYADGDISVEALGAGVIRIGAGFTVQRGDLLMSAGDGTAKPQDDDIVRSKTIAKVTGNVVLETFDDGSYLVACVLMAG
jgi:hypothetical protein